jgi:eukaryotic-like serine/threonine-protein kinase
MRLLLTLIVASLLAVPASAEWPVHRYDFTHQGFDATNTEFGVFTEQWWKDVNLATTVKASPIVAEGRVYVGGWDKFLYALDSESGSVLWKTDLKAKITSTAAASESTVYAVTETGVLYALEARTGAIERQTSIGPTFGTITVHERRIFVGINGGKVSAYEGDNFLLVWTFNLAQNFTKINPAWPDIKIGGEVEGAPVVYNGKVFFGSTNQYMYAVSEEGTGQDTTDLQWVYKSGGAIRGSAAIDKVNGRVIFGAMDGKLYSVSTTSGTIAWTHAQVQGSTSQTTPSQIQSSPAIAYDKVFFGANNGNIVAVTLSGGTQVWSKTTGGQVVSSPAVANNLVVVGSSDWNLYVLNQTDGAERWKNKASRPIESSIAITGTQAFWGSTDGGLYSWGGAKPLRADLTVVSITGSLTAGESGTLSATVKNQGTLNSAATEAQFFSVDTKGNKKLISAEAVPAMEPGDQKKVSAPFSGAGSAITIRVVVDPANAIKELDEGNNAKDQKVTVKAAAASGEPTDSGGAPGLEAVLIIALIGAVAYARRRKA